jgi:hypothetical protein
VHFGFIFPLALGAVKDLHVKLRCTAMLIKEHEKSLMQLKVLCKLGPAAPEVHLTMAIVVRLHFIRSSSSRFFAEDSLSKLAPVHELSKF